MSQTSSCPTCGHANPVGATFCISCSLVLGPLDDADALLKDDPEAMVHGHMPFPGTETSNSAAFDAEAVSRDNANSTDSSELAILTTPTVFLADDPLSFSAEFAAFEVEDASDGQQEQSEDDAHEDLALPEATNGDAAVLQASELAEPSSDLSDQSGDSLAARLRKHLQRSRASSHEANIASEVSSGEREVDFSSSGLRQQADDLSSSQSVSMLHAAVQPQDELPEDTRPSMASLDLRALLVPTVALEPMRLDDARTTFGETSGSEDDEIEQEAEQSLAARPHFLTARPRRTPAYAPLPRPQTHAVPATLTLFQHRRAVERYPLTEAVNVVGRKGPGVTTTVLDLGELDPAASPAFQHATIFQTNRNFTLHVTSDAGTQVNREVLPLGSLRKLQHGDVVIFGGKHPLHFEIHED